MLLFTPHLFPSSFSSTFPVHFPLALFHPHMLKLDGPLYPRGFCTLMMKCIYIVLLVAGLHYILMIYTPSSANSSSLTSVCNRFSLLYKLCNHFSLLCCAASSLSSTVQPALSPLLCSQLSLLYCAASSLSSTVQPALSPLLPLPSVLSPLLIKKPAFSLLLY